MSVNEDLFKQLIKCPRCRRNQVDDVMIEKSCYHCGKTAPCTTCKCGATMCLGCRIKVPQALAPENNPDLIFHPPVAKQIPITIDMEWNIMHGWTFLVSPKKLPPKGFEKAIKQVYDFYSVMKTDLESKKQNVAEDIARSLVDLEPEHRRVRQFIRPRPESMEIQI